MVRNARLLLALLLTLLPTANAWGQQTAAPTTTSVQRPAAPMELSPAGDPSLPPCNPQADVFCWRVAGVSPLLTQDIIKRCAGGAEFGKDDFTDEMIFAKIADGSPGCETAQTLFFDAISFLVNDGLPLTESYKEEVRRKIRGNMLLKRTFHKGDQFLFGMAWGYDTSKGRQAKITKKAVQIAFDHPLEAWIIPMERTSLIIPKICFNVSGTIGEAAPTVVKAEKRMATAVFNKKRQTVEGKDAKTPSRTDEQFRVEISSVNGGVVERLEFMNNERSASIKLPVGETFVAREIYNSNLYRPITSETVTFTVEEKGNTINFLNMEQFIDEQFGRQMPIPVAKTIVEHRGNKKRNWFIAGLIGGAVVAGTCAFTDVCKGGPDVNIYTDPTKNAVNNPSPKFTIGRND